MSEHSAAMVVPLHQLPSSDGFSAISFGRVVDDETPAPQDPFDAGFLAGLTQAEEALRSERERLASLVAAAQNRQAELPSAMSSEILALVETLVVRLTGAAPVNPEWLKEKIDAAQAIVADQLQPRILRLHPADIALIADTDLNLEILADDGLVPGNLILESGATRVEDGRDTGLAQLRDAIRSDAR